MEDRLPVLGEGMDYQLWRRRLLALQERVSLVTASAYSDDGLVSVTVGGRGELIALTLDPRVYRMSDSRRLAKLITSTVRDATEQVRAQIAMDFREILAGRSPRP